MYSNTRLGQIMKGLPRVQFDQLVAQAQADKHSKGFRCWDQFVAMVYGQLAGARSLRELEAGFNAQSHHHYHLGTRPIRRSTLAEANVKRDCGLYARCCAILLSQLHRRARRELKDLLYILDSTSISLAGRGQQWAQAYRNNMAPGLKLHLMIEGHQALPLSAQITPMKTPDIQVGRDTPIEKGQTYVFDKGYYDYNWWHAIETAGAFFVTRLKKNAKLKRDDLSPLTPADSQAGILEDAQIRPQNRLVRSHTRQNAYYDKPLRRITVDRPDKDTPLVLVTNDFERSASDIATLYKQRWAIELFFKWLKQNLKIKRFMGESENAVRIQLYTALIAYILVHLYGRRQHPGQSLYLVLASLKTSLFERLQTAHTVEKRRRRYRQLQAQIQPQLAL